MRTFTYDWIFSPAIKDSGLQAMLSTCLFSGVALFKEHAENTPDKAPTVSQLWQEKKELPKKETNFPCRKKREAILFSLLLKRLSSQIISTHESWFSILSISEILHLPERIQSMGENIRLRVRHLTYSLWLAGYFSDKNNWQLHLVPLNPQQAPLLGSQSREDWRQDGKCDKGEHSMQHCDFHCLVDKSSIELEEAKDLC